LVFGDGIDEEISFRVAPLWKAPGKEKEHRGKLDALFTRLWIQALKTSVYAEFFFEALFAFLSRRFSFKLLVAAVFGLFFCGDFSAI
jgi:hypothetical protein